MRIKRLQIENFRSIQHLDVRLTGVCALVGPNNSRKINLLEAIRRVLAPDWGPRATDFSEEDVYLQQGLIALDDDMPIQAVFREILNWLAARED